MNPLTIYARKNPDKSVTIYRDSSARTAFCVIPGNYADCPDRRYKRITINCVRWALCWI